jgi:hypothetical protein
MTPMCSWFSSWRNGPEVMIKYETLSHITIRKPDMLSCTSADIRNWQEGICDHQFSLGNHLQSQVISQNLKIDIFGTQRNASNLSPSQRKTSIKHCSGLVQPTQKHIWVHKELTNACVC